MVVLRITHRNRLILFRELSDPFIVDSILEAWLGKKRSRPDDLCSSAMAFLGPPGAKMWSNINTDALYCIQDRATPEIW